MNWGSGVTEMTGYGPSFDSRRCSRNPCPMFSPALGQSDLLSKGFDVLTAVVIKSSVFWDGTPLVDLQRTRRRYIPEDRTRSRGLFPLE
jgi:hypothetical protein